jgi:hypothetical protein
VSDIIGIQPSVLFRYPPRFFDQGLDLSSRRGGVFEQRGDGDVEALGNPDQAPGNHGVLATEGVEGISANSRFTKELRSVSAPLPTQEFDLLQRELHGNNVP